jgi:predicted Zn-dependent protease with MMP-like domain
VAREGPGSPDLDEHLERIEDLYEKGDVEGVRKAVARASKLFRDAPEIAEWQATIARDDERFEEALRILEAVLAAEPGRPFARRARAGLLLDMGRFEEALKELRAIVRERAWEYPSDEAGVRYDLALALDRLGTPAEAEKEFRRAARLAPDDFPEPPRMEQSEFEDLVARALDSIPPAFQPYLKQVTVLARDYPEEEGIDPFALGLYLGVPRTERTQESKDHLDTVLVFKRSHELLGLDRNELEEEVRKTVVHEIAHHFGLGEDDMGEYA